MSGCDFEAVESYVRGELDGPAEAEIGAHLARCAACADELAALREERALFATRAARQPPPPPFAAVLALSRDGARRAAREGVAGLPARAPLRLRTPWIMVGVAAAAAVAALVLRRGDGALPPKVEGSVEIHAEPEACFDDGARASLAPAAAPIVSEHVNVPPCDEEPTPADDGARSCAPCGEPDAIHDCASSHEGDVTNTCSGPREGEGD